MDWMIANNLGVVLMGAVMWIACDVVVRIAEKIFRK